MTTSNGITVSIVSHQHGATVVDLVKQVLNQSGVVHVILTLNVAESLDLPSADRLEVVRNVSPQGFGANHNAAFAGCQTPYFCVLNPDIGLTEGVFEALANCLRTTKSTVAAPLVLSPNAAIEDSWRRFPTFFGLVCKAFGRDPSIWPQASVAAQPKGLHHQSDALMATVEWPDWVAGMCMLFESEAFRALKGFDEGFFLYYEDVDICARTWQSGSTVVACPAVSVIHDAQRASHRNWRHMRWHAQSMARYFWKYAWRLPQIKKSR